MKTILATFLTALLLLPISTFGEIQTVTHTVKQSFGGSQSPDDARISAVAKAKREALEMAGTYIESLTVVKNSQVDKDEILALAAGVLKAEVVSQKNYASKDAFGIDVVVKVVVDTSVLEERVKKLLQDKTHLEQLNQARAREKELLEKIAVLEGENRKSGKSDQQQANLKKEFHDASRGLSAVAWFEKGVKAIRIDSWNVALYALNKAIELKPDYDLAFYKRGLVYVVLNKPKQAIKDFTKAISLKPDQPAIYYGRGLAYNTLGNHEQSIKDFTKAIELEPISASAYMAQGLAYSKSGNHQQGIIDLTKAIELEPDYAEAYYWRGLSSVSLGNQEKGSSDIKKAASLGNKEAQGVVKEYPGSFSD